MGDSPPQVTVSEAAGGSEGGAGDDQRRKQEIAGQEKAFENKYGMAKPKSSDLLRRRLSKGGKGQYFDSGDYNMSGVPGGAQRPESKLAAGAAPAVTPGFNTAAIISGRRKSQPSKLGGGPISPTLTVKPDLPITEAEK